MSPLLQGGFRAGLAFPPLVGAGCFLKDYVQGIPHWGAKT